MPLGCLLELLNLARLSCAAAGHIHRSGADINSGKYTHGLFSIGNRRDNSYRFPDLVLDAASTLYAKSCLQASGYSSVSAMRRGADLQTKSVSLLQGANGLPGGLR